MWRPLWVIGLCWLPFASFALQLLDGQNFRYDVGKNGVLQQGTLNTYNKMYALRVNGTSYVGDVSTLTNQGQEVVTTQFTEPKSGLQIHRRLYVSQHYNFARYMEILTNPTDQEKVVDVEIFGQLGSGSRTQVVNEQTQFLITDDQPANTPPSGMPALLHYHSQIGSGLIAKHQLQANNLNWVYPQVTVPAQSRVRLIYFIAQTTSAQAAYEFALQFPSNFIYFYETILPNQRNELINFFPPPVQTPQFTDPLFLNVGETRSGFQLDANDSESSQRETIVADQYALELEGNETVAIRMTAGFDAYLYLFDEQGNLLASNDNQRPHTTQAEILFTAPTAGNYFLEATAHQPEKSQNYGLYSLDVRRKTRNRPPLVYPFQIVAESLTAPATVNFIDFSEDKEGEIVERCWQFGDGTPRSCTAEKNIVHTYVEPGFYTVGLTVEDSQGARRYHSETVAIAPVDEGVILPISNAVEGELTRSDNYSQTRSYAFTDRYIIDNPPIGEELVITLRSDDFNSMLYLYDAYERQIRVDNDSAGGQDAQLRYTPRHPDRLILEATSFNDNQTGRYTLSLNLVKNAPPLHIPIAAATSLNNALQNLLITRLPASFEPNLFLWDFGDGSTLVGSDKAVVSHVFPSQGRYTINVEVLDQTQQVMTGERNFDVNYRVSAPQPAFSATPLFGEAPLRVFFTNDSQSDLTGDQLDFIWQFGDGEIATDKHPAHTFAEEGVYHVILQAYSRLTEQSASYSVPITVIDRDAPEVPVSGETRVRPQVLMVGFDPILVDLLDTDTRIFAIVRAGETPIRTVRLRLNGNESFNLVLKHVATYANGDQRYEAIFPFPRGIYPVTRFTNLFGDQPGQFQVQAVDEAGQFHAYPNVELVDSPKTVTAASSIWIKPSKQVGIRRSMPQVLAAGFDPAIIDFNRGELVIKAIVRAGLHPIQQVKLQQNNQSIEKAMHWLETLPNGDNLYKTTYTYPQGYLQTLTVGDFFGDQPHQFQITVIDQAGQRHCFPNYQIGNFPPQ